MRFIKLLLLVMLIYFSFSINCYASTKTFVRSEDNLLVSKDVVVTENNLNDILATPAVDSSEKIYDYADLFTSVEEDAIYKKLKQYIKDTSIDAVIVTVNDKIKYSIDQYANNFYDYNDFKKNGIIFVVSTGYEEIEIYMGKIGDSSNKVLGIYSDQKINQTLEYVYKDISVGKYNEAITNYIMILDGFYVQSHEGGDYKLDKDGHIRKNIPWIEIIILSSALTFVFDMLLIYKLTGNHVLSKNWEKNINTRTLMVRTDADNLLGNSSSS